MQSEQWNSMYLEISLILNILALLFVKSKIIVHISKKIP